VYDVDSCSLHTLRSQCAGNVHDASHHAHDRASNLADQFGKRCTYRPVTCRYAVSRLRMIILAALKLHEVRICARSLGIACIMPTTEMVSPTRTRSTSDMVESTTMNSCWFGSGVIQKAAVPTTVYTVTFSKATDRPARAPQFGAPMSIMPSVIGAAFSADAGSAIGDRSTRGVNGNFVITRLFAWNMTDASGRVHHRLCSAFARSSHPGLMSLNSVGINECKQRSKASDSAG